MKRWAKRTVAVAMTAAILSGTVPLQSLAREESPDTAAFNKEGVWLTEIYQNDVKRNASSEGYDPIHTYSTESDLMEFIEIASTNAEPVDLNEEYEVYYGDTKLNITDMNGNSAIQISRGQPVVIWNYRSDLEPTMTADDFREAMRLPEQALLLKTDTKQNWSADGAKFTIKKVSDQSVVSEFTCRDKTDTMDGFAVELKIPDIGSEMQVYRQLTLPSAGYVYFGQYNGLMPQKESRSAQGVYVTEIRPNDMNRSSQYGVSDDLMECIELTNTTDQTVDLNQDYSVKYTIKEGNRKSLPVYHWAEDGTSFSTEDCVIGAGETAVLWCYRADALTGYTSFPTEAEFRTAYNIPENVPVYVFTNQNGMNNSNRAIEVYKNDEGTQTLISSYSYIGNSDCKDNRSVELAVNPEGPEMLVHRENGNSTMGTVAETQLIPLADDGSSLQLKLADTVPETIMQGDELRVKFEYTVDGALPMTSVETFCRYDGEGTWHSVSAQGQLRQMDGKVQYTAAVNANDLFDHSSVEFYVKASNQYRSSYSQIYKVEILPLNVQNDVRVNVKDGQAVSGIVTVTANDGSVGSAAEIYLDGVKQETAPMLEDGAYFNFVTSGRDSYFRNAVTTTEDEWIAPLGQWLDTILDGQAMHIDNRYFTYNEANDTYDVTLRFWAGTWIDTVDDHLVPGANREDFKATNMKLTLINGKEYLPVSIGPDDPETKEKTNLDTAYDAVHNIGDSSGMCPYMDVSFQVPAADATAVGTQIDTSALSDGEHTLLVKSGDITKSICFRVDNQKPVIDLKMVDGSIENGAIVLEPVAKDETQLESFTVLLDGSIIDLPYQTTAYCLGKGEHVLSAYAVDAAGNQSVETATFSVEDPTLTLVDMGAQNITDTSAQLYLDVDSHSETEEHYYRAERIDTAAIETNTTAGILPYIQYTLDVSNYDLAGNLSINWNGSASNADNAHAETMYVQNTTTDQWDEIARADENGNISNATFSLADHTENGMVTVLVQCTADSALPTLSSETDGKVGEEDPNAGWDGNSAPADYDFAFAWETDTQYYAEQWQHHYLNMNHWICDNAEEQKIKYVIHTGDIVDDYDMLYQWDNADAAMQILDDAEIPYGVLGGNHDVAAGLDDYENYNQYFGEERFASKPYYGGSYQNNKGHYDLLSEGGQDFIVVYMSWDIRQPEIDWMNEVLHQYSDRKAIICFHTYLRADYNNDALIDYFGEMIQREVVAKNPNVFAVLNGHYHGSSYQTEYFDDDHDGIKERVVYQICTDYQSGFEGGSGYIKMLYFDLDNNKIYVNSYSPSFDDYNFYDDKNPVNLKDAADANGGMARDTMVDKAVLDVPFHTDPGTILENSISAYYETEEELDQNQSGLEPEMTYYWYGKVNNADGDALVTPVAKFTTLATESIETPDTGKNDATTPDAGPDKEAGQDTELPDQQGADKTNGTAVQPPKTGDRFLWEIPVMFIGLTGIVAAVVRLVWQNKKQKKGKRQV